MAAENFKVKKGLEVGTGITANSDGVNVTGIVTATQFKGDGSGLTGVVGSGSGIVVKDEGSAVGTAGTVNFVGSGVAATLSAGTATVTINSGGLSDIVGDTTPQLGGNLDLNSNFITGSGNIDITGSLDVSGIATVGTLKGAIQATTASFSGAIDANGDLDVDGQTNLDDVRISGVTTMTGTLQGSVGSFSGNVSGNQGTFSGNITGPLLSISPGSGDDGIILLNSAGGQNNDFSRIRQVVSDDSFRIENKSSGSYESLLTGIGGAGVKLYFAGNQKLTTTINGIEVPDLNVTGVGTVGRLDTNGVTLGTNNNTFAAKFIDNAVANFGTGSDLQILHDGNRSAINNSGGELRILSGSDIIIGKRDAAGTSYSEIIATFKTDGACELYHDGSNKKLETTEHGVVITGVATATSFSGDGSALTGITASGSGVVVKHDGSTVGTAGTINFSTNLDVSAISAGIVTVTASGSSGVSLSGSTNNTVATVTGANALIGEANLTFDGSILDVNGVITANSITLENNGINLQSSHDIGVSATGLYVNNTSNNATIASFQFSSGCILRDTNSTIRLSTTTTGVTVAGTLTATTFSGSGASLTTLNASELDSGTIPNGRFPTTLPAIGGGALTDLNASALTTGTVPTGRFGTNNVSPSSISVTSSRILGRVSSGTNSAEELTAAQVRTLLNVADGATAGITEVSQDTTPDLGGNLNLNSKDITGTGNVNITGIVTTTNLDVSVAYTLGAAGSDHFTFTGGEFASATNDPDLYLERGRRYLFVNPVAGSHPFEIRKPTSGDNSAAAYSTGVTGNGGSGNVIFDVPLTAPSHLYYQCTSHSNMGGNIYITGREDVNVQLSHRNLIINGDMEIAQRGGSVITVPNDTPTFTVDRFGFDERTGGSAQLRQSTDVPAGQGFYNSLYANIVSTDTSISGNENAKIRYVVEDVDVRHLQWGTANAKPLTVSFWVKSNAVGQTYCFNVSNWPTNTRSFIAEYTLPSGTSDSWQKHVINIPGDTTGTWTHITLQWALTASSDYQRSGTGWAAWSGSGALEIATSNQYNWFGDSNHFYLTGVQLERGNVSTPFEHKSFAEQLARCQRYCVVYGASGEARHLGCASAYNSTNVNLSIHLPVPMRAKPSASTVTSGGNWLQAYMGATGNISNASISVADHGVDHTAMRVYLQNVHSSGLTAGQALWLHTIANAKLILSAEL